MALDSCDWASPGADRYTGTAASAIHAFATIPEPVRQRLVGKHDRRAYDDIVHIDRDSIRGRKEAWDPAIRDMHFGSRGKRCGRVDRSMWTSAQVESAVVYCDSGYCVAWPSVCGNWFVIAPQAARLAMLTPMAGAGPAAIVDGDDDVPGDAAGGAVFGEAAAVPSLADGAETGAFAVLNGSAVFGGEGGPSGSAGGGSGGGGGGFGSAGGAGAPTSFLSESAVAATPPIGPSSTAVVTPIPEPSTWAAMLAGLTALGAHARRRRARHG